MSKKNPTRVIKMPTSPEAQIRTRARNLKMGKCYLNENWEKAREGLAIVTREHVNGNLTVGFFLVDLAMLGVKEASYAFNMPRRDFEEIRDDSRYADSLYEVEYNFVHNLIYGAVAFAEEHGCEPHRDFATAQFILEEDTDDIQLIEFEFGVDGEPVLFSDLNEDLDEGLDEDEYDDPEDDPLFNNGWDDDIDAMGVPEWGEKEWTQYFSKPKEEQSFRVFQYFVDNLFWEEHPEIDELDAFEVVTGGLTIDQDVELHIPDREREFLEGVVNVEKELHPGIVFALAAKGVKMFPKSKTLHYLWLVYGFAAGEEEGYPIYQKCLKKFPNDLDFKNMYAGFLLSEGRYEEVPAVYNNREVLADFFEGKEAIEFRAAVGFCHNYCWYYNEKEDLMKAEPFYQVLDTILDTGIDPIHRRTIYQNVILKLHLGIRG